MGQRLLDVVSSLHICKYFYNIVYNSAAKKFRRMILSVPYSYIQFVNEDVKLNVLGVVGILNYKGSRELVESIDYFLYINKRIRPEIELVDAPEGQIPKFHNLKSDQKVSLCHLFKMFRGQKSHGLVCTVSMCFE